jgi:hypothetical protein
LVRGEEPVGFFWQRRVHFGTHETDTGSDEEQRDDAKPQAIVDSVANTAGVDQDTSERSGETLTIIGAPPPVRT